MENMQSNSEQPQGGLSDKLMKMFTNYEQSHETGNGTSKPVTQNILTKYFTPRNRTEIFRILPPLPGRDYIETAYFHVVKVNTPTGKRFKKIYCPAHNERVPKKDAQGNVITDKSGNPVLVPAPCPLCEANKRMLAQQDSSIRGIKKEDMNDAQLAIKEKNYEIWKNASQWEAKKFYIVRGIDKGAEKDGVKFWRFKHNFRQQGVQDKLVPVLGEYIQQYRNDFTDINNGTDLRITVVDAKMPNGNTYKDVTAIGNRGPSQLHTDPIILRQWLDDKITWRDVFKPAKAPGLESFEYMERVLRGVDPYWDDTDSNNKRWVFPDPADSELQEKANTRDMNLDADNKIGNSEMASDVMINYNTGVNINNVTADNVGTFKDNSVDMGSEFSNNVITTPEQPVQQEQPVVNQTQQQSQPSTTNTDFDSVDDYEDLPF